MLPDADLGLRSAQELSRVLRTLPMPVLVRRLGDGPLLPTFLNEKALELFEADSLEDLLASYGGDLLNAIHPDDVELLREKDLRIASMEVESAFYEVRIVTKGGRQRLVRVLSKGMRDEDGDMELVNVALWLDACADAGTEEDIDPVTGLISMRTFLDVMERTKEDEGLEGDGSGLAVLYVGVVDFRTASLVNGAETSGALLRSLGDLLRMTFDAIAVSRADTSHLAVLLHSDNLEAKANVVNARVQELMPTGIGVSLGACVWGDRRLSPDDVCERARAACDVNRMHANTYFSLYSTETGRALDDAEYVVANIDEAIRNHWITVCYQPVIRSVSGHLCGMEALSRWEDPKRGMLSPAAFIGPLEDARLIWKLDLHVVRQVVLLISDRNRNGLEEIPISVNLSQIDFLCCDMFAEIEALVREHDVPRRALHIEVTESAFASRQDVVVRTLDRFRAAGYEVWVDDFGSGYSSLHLLDDYHVDVIKLDMAFLREETERSRKIISSIVAMGKRIGVRVLAEGVETEEQARFLRTIGCAKVQGNHFGVPRPFEKSLGACLDHGHPVENAKEKEFLDEVAEIDMITDVAQMVFDYCSRTFHIMLCNEPALRMSRRYGAADAKHFENAVNEWNRLSGYDLDKAVSYAIQTGKVGEQVIRFFGKEMVFRFRCRGQVDGHCLIVAQYFDYDKRAMKLADLTRTMTSVLEFYRNVFLVDLRGKTVRSLRFGNYVTDDDELDGEMIRGDGSELPSLYPSVIETDQDAYREFVDASTMRTRLLRTRGRALRRMFRTLDEEGERFVWMEHALSFVRDSDTEQVLYGIRPLDVGTLPKELADVRNESSLTLSEDGEPVGNVLWSSLMAHVSLKLFWKDKDRRFLGANKAFLEYYGFDSASEIIGRTDDELDWHPDESPYREDELEVLRSGTTSRDVVGRCIARGEARSIVSTKWPVYRDGRVAGLMGYFDEREPGASVAGDAAADHGAAAGQAAPASAPRMGNGFSQLEDFLSYLSDYWNNQRRFGAIFVRVPEMQRIARLYGKDVEALAAAACEEAIAGVLGIQGSMERIDPGRYMILRKYETQDEMTRAGDEIRAAIGAIHKVGDYQVTLFAETSYSYEKQLVSFIESLSRTLFGDGDVPAYDSAGAEALASLMDSIPIGCYAICPDHMIRYWNPEAERILGFSSQETVGRRCVHMPFGCSYASGEGIPIDQCPAVFVLGTGKPKTMTMLMRNKDGKEVLVRNTMAPLRDKDGKIRELISFFVPLVDEGFGHDMVRKVYEVATRDPVTCLPGRKYIEACIEDALELYRRTGQRFAVLFADLDKFHELNNAYGHETGDDALRAFAIALGKFGRRTDSFCRWGGDEFVGLLQLRSEAEMEKAARRLMRVAPTCTLTPDGHKVALRASVGITAVRDDDDLKTLVDRADRYMYEAKGRATERIVTDKNAGQADAGTSAAGAKGGASGRSRS